MAYKKILVGGLVVGFLLYYIPAIRALIEQILGGLK